MKLWKDTDEYEYRGFELEMILGWDFMQTAEQMSWPKLNHPTVILHGIQDDVVPIENSRRVMQEQANVVKMIELDDGHRMQQSKSHFEMAAELLVNN